jgi:Flp pilus assembly protein TadG
MSRDRGSVTAELAACLPVVVLLLLTGLTGVDAVVTKLRCVDAAREGARAAARGESADPAARRAAPQDATVSVRVEADTVRVSVRTITRPLGSRLPGLPVSAEAVAALEPGTP